MRNSFVKNESGLSLVEVMVVGVILTIMALGIATLMKKQNEQQIAVRDRAEMTNIQTVTRGNAANAAAVQRSILVSDP